MEINAIDVLTSNIAYLQQLLNVNSQDIDPIEIPESLFQEVEHVLKATEYEVEGKPRLPVCLAKFRI